MDDARVVPIGILRGAFGFFLVQKDAIVFAAGVAGFGQAESAIDLPAIAFDGFLGG